MSDSARPSLPICKLCDDWPGPLFDMSRPCCCARWVKRLPPHYDKKELVRNFEREKGAEFVQSMRAYWGMVT